jgi:hypothetical protein
VAKSVARSSTRALGHHRRPSAPSRKRIVLRDVLYSRAAVSSRTRCKSHENVQLAVHEGTELGFVKPPQIGCVPVLTRVDERFALTPLTTE